MQEMQAVWAWPLGWEDPLEGAWPPTPVFWGFPGGSAGKEFVCNVGDLGSIPGLGRSPGGGHGHPLQYSGASLGAQMVKNLPAMWETWVRSLGWEDPLEEGMATHCSILAWRILMDRGAWWATVHGGHKEWDMTEWLSPAQHSIWFQSPCSDSL